MVIIATIVLLLKLFKHKRNVALMDEEKNTFITINNDNSNEGQN
jgi:hypothetical protein